MNARKMAVLACLGVCCVFARARAEGFIWSKATESDNWYAYEYIEESEPPEYINNWGRTGTLPLPFPGIGDDVTIGGSPVVMDDSAQVRNVTLSGWLVVPGFMTLRVDGPSLHNTGLLTLDSISDPSAIIFDNTDTFLSGGGTVDLSGPGANVLQGVDGNEYLTTDNTIQGHGGVSSMGVTNTGLIHANVSGETLAVHANTRGLVNSGTLRASGGASMSLRTDGVFDNTGGTIEAQAGSTMQLHSHAATGGTLNVFGEAELHGWEFTGGTVYNSGTTTTQWGTACKLDAAVTNTATGQIVVGGGSSLTLTDTGSYANAGEIRLEGNSFFDAVLRLSGTVSLTGGGSLVLAGAGTDSVRADGAAGELINTDNTICGSGNIGHDQLALVNHGLIHANVSGQTLELNPADAAGMTNTGTLRASSGGTLKLHNDTFTNTGGALDIQAGSRLELQDVTVNGGRLDILNGAEADLKGLCNFTGDALTNAGTIRLGTATGVTVTAAVTNSAGGLIDLYTGTWLKVSDAGTVHNDGLIQVAGGSNAARMLCSGTVTLTGTGTITLGARGWASDRIEAEGSSGGLTNVGNRIEGRGYVGWDEVAMVNGGVIDANHAGGTLYVDPGDTGGLVNTGTIQASGGGTLELKDAIVDNTGGVIQALAGSQLLLRSGAPGDVLTITGGTIQALGGSAELSNVTFTGGSLNNTGTVTVRSATVSAAVSNAGGGQIVLPSGSLSLTAIGDCHNAGEIRVEDLPNVSGGRLYLSGTVRLTGGGSLALTGDGVSTVEASGTGPARLVNVNNTIHGGGHLGYDELALTNEATIDADTAGRTLHMDPENTSGAVNTGTMRASGGGTLQLSDGTFTNTGGMIQAMDGSVVKLDEVTIVGGTLATAGTGVIRVQGPYRATLEDVSNTGYCEVPDYGDAALIGTIDNSGQIEVNGTGGLTQLFVSGTVTFTGGGAVTLSDSLKNRIEGYGAGDALVNAGHTISGAGYLGYGELAITNTGTIEATGVNRLEVDLVGTAGMTNDGMMRAVGTGGLYFPDNAFTNAGTVEILSASEVKVGSAGHRDYIQTGGTTSLQGGVLDAGTVYVQGGSMVGSGTVDAHLSVTGGTVAPGLSVGLLTIMGDYSQGSGGELEIDIASLTSFDRVLVNAVGGSDGNATLAGAIDVNLLGVYAPTPDSFFDVLTADGTLDITGLTITGDGASWIPSVVGNVLRLSVSEPVLPGDANGDGVVNAADYIALKTHIGQGSGATTADGDFDGDGDVDWDDLQLLEAHYGQSSAGSGTIPEPATLSLLALGGLTLIRRRRR